VNKVSAIINIYNEAHLLEECIQSLRGFADEIVVSDMQSTDGGGDLARQLGCIVFSFPHHEVVEHSILPRIQKATGEWVLLFDPDMRLPTDTARRLREVVRNDEADIVQFKLINRVFGYDVTHGHGASDGFIKFFKRRLFLESPVKEPRIHAMVSDTLKAVDARWLRLGKEYPLIHLAYPDLHKCFQQHLRYACYEANERWERGERFSVVKLLWEPFKKFLIDFGYFQAWRDGMPAMIYSFISELMIVQVHLFLWEKQKNKV
jgi:(heptosyl)LPS beta-1,4-glucosyltransferase